MKNAITLAFLLFFLAFAFLFRADLQHAAYSVLYRSPCDTPLAYSIGGIDSRFEISRDQVLQDAEESQAVWNKAEGKTLLEYDPNSSFTVSLVYDGRQKLNNQINNLNSDLTQENNSLQPEVAAYENRVVDFKNKLAAFNQEVDSWNKKGGAPADVYKSLIDEQNSLRAEASSLNEEARNLNQSTQQYNVGVQQLNQTINNFNTALQFKPEEGLFTQNGFDKKIAIYFYSSKQELVHTITHEMGHALGLAHVQDQNAIMFPQTNGVIVPSSADLAELNTVCEKKNVVSVGISNLINNFKFITTR